MNFAANHRYDSRFSVSIQWLKKQLNADAKTTDSNEFPKFPTIFPLLFVGFPPKTLFYANQFTYPFSLSVECPQYKLNCITS